MGLDAMRRLHVDVEWRDDGMELRATHIAHDIRRFRFGQA
jgi:hypothetical protein